MKYDSCEIVDHGTSGVRTALAHLQCLSEGDFLCLTPEGCDATQGFSVPAVPTVC